MRELQKPPRAHQDAPRSVAFSIKSNIHAPWRETLALTTEGEESYPDNYIGI